MNLFGKLEEVKRNNGTVVSYVLPAAGKRITLKDFPQIQEEMTTQIADKLVQYAKTPNVAVVVKAEHHCMTHRGVKEHDSDMTTAVMLGKFRDDPNLKQEFYNLMLSMKGHK